MWSEKNVNKPRRSEDECDDVWEAFNPDVIAAHEAKEGPIKYDADYLEDFDIELHGDMTEEEAKEALAPAIAKLKWKEIRDPILLDPKEFEPVVYKVEQNLREKFKDSGLQVIVKMASIELTPEKPDFPAGGWHVGSPFAPLISRGPKLTLSFRLRAR